MIEAETREILAALAAQNRPPVERMTPDEFRALIKPLPAEHDDAARVASMEERTLAGVPTRVYRPVAEPRGTMLYFHGGGFVVGSAAGSDATVQALVARTALNVVSVDYRLAPEHPYPAAVEDTLAVLEFAAAQGLDGAGDSLPLLVGGESAGANLAAVAAIAARDRDIPVRHQTLFYPVTDCDFDRPSYLLHGAEAPLTRAAMMWFWDHYAPVERRDEWHASPINAALAGVAPAHVSLPSHDPLRDEGQAYADRLRGAGVEVTVDVCDGLVHGFVSFLALSPGGKAAFDRACVQINRHLAAAPAA